MQESDEIQHTCSSRCPSPDFSLLVSTTDVAGLLGPEAQPLPGLQSGLPASSETTALLRSSFPTRAHTHPRHLTPHSFLPNFPPAREAQGAGCAQRCRRCGEACHLPPAELPTGPEELHPWTDSSSPRLPENQGGTQPWAQVTQKCGRWGPAASPALSARTPAPQDVAGEGMCNGGTRKGRVGRPGEEENEFWKNY